MSRCLHIQTARFVNLRPNVASLDSHDRERGQRINCGQGIGRCAKPTGFRRHLVLDLIKKTPL